MLVDSCPRVLLDTWVRLGLDRLLVGLLRIGDEEGRISTFGADRAGQYRPPDGCDISISNMED